MAPAPGELEVGRIGRPHGLRGEVNVTFVSNRPERMRPGAALHAGSRTLVIETARPRRGTWLVHFVGIDDRDAAEALRGAVLTAEPLGGSSPLGEGEFWIHELIDMPVVDIHGRSLGSVAGIEANPAHDLLVLDNGALVPMTFVVDARDGVVVVDPPDGLFEI